MGETTTTFAVHRCRFVDYTPSAITSIAFSPLPLPPAYAKKTQSNAGTSRRVGTLAVGHANGDIELWEWAGDEKNNQCSQAWVCRKTLRGPYPSKVDAIAFAIRHPDDFGVNDVPKCSELRLFSSGGGSELLEWDIAKGCIRRSIGSQGGSIWCMATNPASNTLALGCEDGTIHLLSLVNDTLTHLRRFDRIKGRILSVAWGPPVPKKKQNHTNEAQDSDSDEDEEDDWTDSWLVTGGSDSSIRKWDVTTGRPLERMGTDKIRGERTLVWTVGVLGNGTIVSGDSLGMVKFWDSRTCTQLQSFPAHGADVLCLTIGPDGTTVYTSGVDQKTTQFSLVTTGGSSTKWIQSSSRRMHSHDVRALATWPPYTPLPPSHVRALPKDVAPILASGGLDMSVVLTPVALPSSTTKTINPLATSVDATFEESYYRRLAYNVGAGSSLTVKVASKARLVLCLRAAGLTVWKVPPRQSPPEDPYSLEAPNPGKTGWEKALEMDFSVQTNLASSAISDDGRWLAVSDVYETKLYSLTITPEGQLTPKRIRNFTPILQSQLPASTTPNTGSSNLLFTPDSSKLVLCTALTPYVLVLDLTGDQPKVLRRFDQHRLRGSLAGDRVVKSKPADGDVQMSEDDEVDDANQVLAGVSIQQVAVSPDGQWLATTDDHCRTHIFNLDSIQHHTVLPSFSKPAQVLAFTPAIPNTLILGFPDNSIQVFNVETRQFPAWGKDFSSHLPKRFLHAHDPILGIMFDPVTTAGQAPHQALFWGSTWLCKLDLKRAGASGQSKKRRRESIKAGEPAMVASEDAPGGPGGGQHHKMVTHYRPILYANFMGPGEIIVVERPLVDVLSTLPPAYFKHKYGAS